MEISDPLAISEAKIVWEGRGGSLTNKMPEGGPTGKGLMKKVKYVCQGVLGPFYV